MIFGVNANGTPVKFKRTGYTAVQGNINDYARIAKLARIKKLKWIKRNELKVQLLQA